MLLTYQMLPKLGGNRTESVSCILEQAKRNPGVRYDCCIDAAMSVIEGRWKCTILCLLCKEGPMRFAELQRRIGEISSRILSKQLKELEEDGMVLRTVGSDRKLCVTYSLSSKGMSVLPALAALAEWGARYQMMQVIVPSDDVPEARHPGVVPE